MKGIYRSAVVLLLSATMLYGQTASKGTQRNARRSAQPAVTQQDLQALRDSIQQQQSQLEMLRQELQKRDEQMQQLLQQLQQAQSAARQAEQKAVAVETNANGSQSAVDQLQQDVKDIQQNMTNAALSTQEDQKRMGAIENTVSRFRFGGDVRIRYENFYQENIPDRHRPRIRLRLGVEGQLTQDFVGGVYLATGTIEAGNPTYRDPVSTNETLTSFFERKAVGFDRGWIAFNPAYAKWLTLTGGKFAFTWTRTPLTFDNDLNPEGFSQKLSYEMKNSVLKNLSLTGMELFFNESGTGVDSFAAGAQVSSKLQLGQRVTMTPSYTFLNWRNADVIAANSLIPSGSNATRTLGGNNLTNATVVTGTGSSARNAFLSRFQYNDFILDTNIKTASARFPLRLAAEYLKNTRAATNQDSAFWSEVSLGQTKNARDFVVGYGYARVEQDAVIAAFNESDMRAATNVTQHRVFFNYAFSPSVTGNYTLWVGRTLNTALQNAARAGVPAGAEDPWLKRMQFDLIYKF